MHTTTRPTPPQPIGWRFAPLDAQQLARIAAQHRALYGDTATIRPAGRTSASRTGAAQ